MDLIWLYNTGPIGGLATGAVLQLPDLAAVFEHERLAAVVPAAADSILVAIRLYRASATDLSHIRTAAPVVPGDPGSERRPRLQLPSDLATRLNRGANCLRAAVRTLAAVESDSVLVPTHAIGQLRQAGDLLHALSEGANDGYGYDIDLVDQRLALGVCNLVIWARSGFR